MTGSAPGLTLRTAVPADVGPIAALERDLFGVDAWSAKAVTDELGATGRRVDVAEVVGRLAGYAVTSAAGDVLDLLRIAVAPEVRRRGVASALLATALREAGRDGARRLLLEVSAGNVAALRFYSARGFKEIDRRRRYYRDGSDALVLAVEVRDG